MRFRKWMAPAIFIGACASGAATAQVTYDWSWTGSSDTGSGTLTTSAAITSTNPEQVLTFAGTWDGAVISGLSNYDSPDNSLAGTQPSLSVDGLSFVAAGVDWNLFEDPVFGSFAVNSAGAVNEDIALDFQFSLAPASPVTAPEIDPATATSGLILLAGGLLVLRRRGNPLISHETP